MNQSTSNTRTPVVAAPKMHHGHANSTTMNCNASSSAATAPRKMNARHHHQPVKNGNAAAAMPRKTSPSSSARGMKHGGGNNGSHRKQQRRHSHNSGSGNNNSRDNKRRKLEPMDLEPIFPKLNQSDPVHGRRIQQRRKNVAMGKNTEGYSRYTQQVPKQKRKKRCMETPSTPDHTLDIPAKRWQGMVKAW